MNDEPRKVFRDFLRGVRKDVRLRGCKVNSHWRPQFCFCSIARFIDSYHVIPFANMSVSFGGQRASGCVPFAGSVGRGGGGGLDGVFCVLSVPLLWVHLVHV